MRLPGGVAFLTNFVEVRVAAEYCHDLGLKIDGRLL